MTTWRCKHEVGGVRCGNRLGEALRDKRGRVTWLEVGRVRLSEGWVTCGKCGRKTFWISPAQKAQRSGGCTCGSELCPSCNPVRITKMIHG